MSTGHGSFYVQSSGSVPPQNTSSQTHFRVSRSPGLLSGNTSRSSGLLAAERRDGGLFFGTPDPSLLTRWVLRRVPSRTIPLNPPTALRGHHVHLPEEDSRLPEVTYLERVDPGLEPRSIWAPSSGSSCRSCDPSLGASAQLP